MFQRIGGVIFSENPLFEKCQRNFLVEVGRQPDLLPDFLLDSLKIAIFYFFRESQEVL